MRPVGLKCEHMTDPVGIDADPIRLTWGLQAEGRCRRQTAYQIMVADDPERLSRGEGNLWDSDKIASDNTLLIPYEGRPLLSRQRCWWQVRVWDESDAHSEFSDTAFWEMGLLEPSDWHAQWIGFQNPPIDATAFEEEWFRAYYQDNDFGAVPPFHMRKPFAIDRPVQRATVYATARGVYHAFVNGRRLGDAELQPGWTDYRVRIEYQTFDVTDFLTVGENVIAGLVGEGWYSGRLGGEEKHPTGHYGPRPSFLAQLHVEFEDGSEQIIATDSSWRLSFGAIIYSDLHMGERYDARRELGAWHSPCFDANAWWPVGVETHDDAVLCGRTTHPIMVTEDVPARSVSRARSGAWIVDLGQNMAGRVRLRVRGREAQEIRLRHGEMLDADGSLYTENLGSARAEDTYICSGIGEEVWEPTFTIHGFRYVEVMGVGKEPSLEMVTGRVMHSAMPPTGSFECSSELLNTLHRNIIWGQRGNFVSIPTDCPNRNERLGWTGDIQVFVHTAAYTMDVASFLTKWMVDLTDAQSDAGVFPDVAPLTPFIEPAFSKGSPAWGDAGVIVPWSIYRRYGDTGIVARHFEAMENWMAFIRSNNPDHLRRNATFRDYSDWLNLDARVDKELLATAYWAWCAVLMAEMAEAIGRENRAVSYRRLFDSIKNAFIDAYVFDDGRLKSGTQTAYLLALDFDLLPEDLRPVAARHLVADIESRQGHLSTGFLGVRHLCRVLTDSGHNDLAYRLALEETYPSWGYSIRQGATTIWERWDGWTEHEGFQNAAMNSFNHYCFGSIGEWLYGHVAGIQEASPGFRKILIKPYPGPGVDRCRAEYHAHVGRIAAEWSNSNGEFHLNVEVPPNTTATVHLPVRRDAVVLESGGPAERSEGVTEIDRRDGVVSIEVGSGRFEFEVR